MTPEQRLADALHHITKQLTENLAAHRLTPVERVHLSILHQDGHSLTATASPSTDGTELIWMAQTRSASIEGGPAVEGGRS
ncbi:hypothetical protein [Brevibacterium otitidis]|uniref:Uncharacterized protein n=1 Tax=Brevibacterium otitidis TaxID=53364 RepID=A0ABV5WYX2_9MICO|nr:hypothetical protein GCM10023233_26000 [Brevibacterium otitidis]